MLSIFPLSIFLTSAVFLLLIHCPSPASDKNETPILDERYLFLQNLPKERLKVWLDAYELYKRDKKARKTVTLTINSSKLHNNISSRSKPLVEVHWEELEWRSEFTDGKIYIIGTDTPFTGISHRFHPNGMKSRQTSWKDGKRHGLSIGWHANGLKSLLTETNFYPLPLINFVSKLKFRTPIKKHSSQ